MQRSYGGEVIVAPSGVPADHPDHYQNLAVTLCKENADYFDVDQYDNPNNPEAYYRTLGPEVSFVGTLNNLPVHCRIWLSVWRLLDLPAYLHCAAVIGSSLKLQVPLSQQLVVGRVLDNQTFTDARHNHPPVFTKSLWRVAWMTKQELHMGCCRSGCRPRAV